VVLFATGQVILFLQTFRPVLGPAQRTNQWVQRAFFPEDELSEREFDHLFPSNSKVKNEWSYTFIHPICLHAVPGHFTFLIISVYNNRETETIIAMSIFWI